ncbi:MAG TPA: lysophospholipid acyltransferase family protein [Chitinophagales bacterium]|nr:lysophospholipid acyltransferase family protein [Chitinophagales bacterium]
MQNWWKLPYSIYAIILLFILFTIVFPIYVLIKILIPYSQQTKWVHRTNKIVFIIWSAFTGFTYKIRGVENIDEDQTYVIVCNHNNLADFMASAYGIQVPGKPLVKKELLSIPIIGQLFAMASVPLDRKDENARKKSVEVMAKELEQGISLIIFAEGTRNRTPAPLKEFHNGAFSISMKTGKPILPVVFTNMKNLSSAESILIRPWRIEATHLEAVFPEAFNDTQEYKNHVYRIMWNYLVENDPSFKDYEKL